MISVALASLLISSYLILGVVSAITVVESYSHLFDHSRYDARIGLGEHTVLAQAIPVGAEGFFPIAFDGVRDFIMGEYGEKVTAAYINDSMFYPPR